MTTGNFWNLTKPEKPWGEFDGDDVIDIPFDIATWLSGLGDTYGSHQVICDTGLQCTASSHVAGVITTRIAADGTGLTVGKKYGITWRVVGASGQKKDATLYLKIVERRVSLPNP